MEKSSLLLLIKKIEDKKRFFEIKGEEVRKILLNT